MDANEALRLMRGHAREASEGQNVRREERSLRWLFEKLDEHLSQGRTLPDAWQRPEPHKHPNYSVGIPPRCPQCGQPNPGPSLPAEYSAVGMTDWQWAARLARDASAYGSSE